MFIVLSVYCLLTVLKLKSYMGALGCNIYGSRELINIKSFLSTLTSTEQSALLYNLIRMLLVMNPEVFLKQKSNRSFDQTEQKCDNQMLCSSFKSWKVFYSR